MKSILYKVIATGFCLFSVGLQAQPVIEDEGVSIDRAEMTKIAENWSSQMRAAAAEDLGDRLELLNMALSNKKMALEVEKLSPETDPETYWKYVFWLQSQQRKFVFDHYMEALDIPDMSPLAEERYSTEKDKYALVPEQRRSSHILFSCPPGCDRTEYRSQAVKVLVDLRAGGDFEAMVAEFSGDQKTRKTGGKMDRWIAPGESDITPHYTGALFEIEEAGGYSGVVETEFGLHIIRLDEIRESYYRPFAEVRDSIILDLETEYTELAAKDFAAGFRVTDDVRIDGPAMEEIFGGSAAEHE